MNMLLHEKTVCLLEFGPGTSTNIIGQAIADVPKSDPNYAPKSWSFEENPKWLWFHEEIFVPSLRAYGTWCLGFIGKKT